MFFKVLRGELALFLRGYVGNPKMGSTLANSEDPVKKQHKAAFHQGLHCLLTIIQPSETEYIIIYKHPTCDPSKHKMVSPILIVSICMG